MISVKVPAAPKALLTAWVTEKKRAAKHFALGIPKVKFKFSAYTSEGVKDALEQVFYGKCAYCESDYKTVSHGDIEHYRPKAHIDLGSKHRIVGYYWLAGEIENLLPSCTICNSSSWQDIAGKATKEKVGKGNLFPLADETRRATREGAEAGEYPLLLNPYKDNPDEYLEFSDTGMVTPRPSLRGRRKKRAEETIKIYGLSRLALVRRREDRATRVLGQIDRLKKAYDAWKRTPGSAQREKKVVREWGDLQKLIAIDQPYIAMSKQLIQVTLRQSHRREIIRLAAATTHSTRSSHAIPSSTRKSEGGTKRRSLRTHAPRSLKPKPP